MPTCKLCGAETRFRFASRDHARPADQTIYRIYWCDACEFGRLEGSFTPEMVRKFYPSNYYTHGAGAEAKRERSLRAKIREHLAWRFDYGIDFQPSEVTGESICDIGCGDGHNLRQFKALGKLTAGIEPDPIARARAQNAGPVFQGTAEQIPSQIAEKKFDVVLMSHVLEHCIDPLAAISNARALLAPGGTLVIEVPNNAAIAFSVLGPAWPWCDIPRHLNFFSQRSLTAALVRCGLSVSKTFYTGFVRQFGESWLEMQRQILSVIQPTHRGSVELGAWKLLLRTMRASPEERFDSVRVHASAFANASGSSLDT